MNYDNVANVETKQYLKYKNTTNAIPDNNEVIVRQWNLKFNSIYWQTCNLVQHIACWKLMLINILEQESSQVVNTAAADVTKSCWVHAICQSGVVRWLWLMDNGREGGGYHGTNNEGCQQCTEPAVGRCSPPSLCAQWIL